jgi:hypothetical protein
MNKKADETQADLEEVKMSLDTRMKNLQKS